MMRAEPRLYIFDADGTLRWTTVDGQKYPLRTSEWRLMPNVADRLSAIRWSPDGPWLAIASNQNGVAEGLLDEAVAAGAIREGLDHQRITGVVLQAVMFNTFADTISASSIRDAEPAAEGLWELLLDGLGTGTRG